VGIRSEERLPLNWGTRWVGVAEVFARSSGRPSFQYTIAYSLFMLSKTGMAWRQTNHSAPELLLPPVQTQKEKTRLEAHWFLSNRLFGTLQDFGLLEQRDLPDQQKRQDVDPVRKTTLFDTFISFQPK
jgi:hypothetical protein